ncbi:MAG TPA: type II toxin-antitoxin system HicB family antitoxin [Chloroflexia bacterium]|jgi:predicted RNase H-like HicB family nuclease
MLRHKINPEYLKAAMQGATFKELPDKEGYFGLIPGFQGLWASADTVEKTRAELAEVLKEWVDLGIQFGDPIPDIAGIPLIQG